MIDRPWAYVISGPNGAGKTTLARLLFPTVPTINPDDIARQLSPDNPEKAAFAAGRRAIALVNERVAAGQNFGLETTLSGRWIFSIINTAHKVGFGVALVYVGLESERLAIQRVRERREAGGHDVPDEDVRRLYDRGIGQLPMALARSDHALLYDNSSPPALGPRVFAEFEFGIVTALEADPPGWLIRAFPAGLRIGDDLRRAAD